VEEVISAIIECLDVRSIIDFLDVKKS